MTIKLPKLVSINWRQNYKLARIMNNEYHTKFILKSEGEEKNPTENTSEDMTLPDLNESAISSLPPPAYVHVQPDSLMSQATAPLMTDQDHKTSSPKRKRTTIGNTSFAKVATTKETGI